MELLSFQLIVTVAVIVLAAIAVWRRGGSVVEHLSQLQEAVEYAKDLVASAQQQFESGQIAEDERFNYVYDRLREKFPDLEASKLKDAIEAAVYWIKIIRRSGTNVEI